MRTLPILLLSSSIALAACGPAPSAPVDEGASSSAFSSVPSPSGFRHFEDPHQGFAVDVPSSWTVDRSRELATDLLQSVGTAFEADVASGTTLSEALFHVSRPPECPATTGGVAVTLDGVPFTRVVWDGAAAGNRYEGVTYVGDSGGCIVLTGYLHSCNLGPDCGEGRAAPFDRQRYLDAFDAVARSLRFVRM